MESLKNYIMNLSEQEYHKYPAWSHSLIAKYARNGFKALKTLHDPVTPTPEMEFGSLVDCFATRGEEEVNKRYVVSNDPIPTPAPKAVLDYLLQKSNEPFICLSEELIGEAMEACSFYSSYGYDTKLKKLTPFISYYENRRQGKQVISLEDYNDAKTMANAIKFTFRHLFEGKEGVECLYQPQFLTTVPLDGGAELPIKCMVDFMRVDHNAKTIQLVDIKTSEVPAYDFAQQFVRMRYDIEAQVYSYVVGKIKNVNPDYWEYKILPYLFIDISRSDKVPVMYKFDQDANNRTFSYKDYVYKNWLTLLQEINLYESTSASVPSYISITEPNDIVELLNHSDNA